MTDKTNKTNNGGFFISFEGLEGAGKSTQVGVFASRLKEEGREVVATREPGGTRIGEQIRNITHSVENVDLTAAAEAYLMAGARAQHTREIIIPALESGRIVVCDRFIDSSLAYQGFGRELGFEAILELNRMAIQGNIEHNKTDRTSKGDLLLPDITILLEISLEEGMRRRNGTDKMDRLDLQQKEFYRRVGDGYKRIVREYG